MIFVDALVIIEWLVGMIKSFARYKTNTKRQLDFGKTLYKLLYIVCN